MTPQEHPAHRLPNTASRFLTICEGGNCRSVSLAMLLKGSLQYDAVACSWKDISPETLHMLLNWADCVIVMEAYMAAKIPEKYHNKVNIIDVGPDVWCNPFHPDLIDKIQKLIAGIPLKFRTRNAVLHEGATQ